MTCPKCGANQRGPDAEGKRGNGKGIIDSRDASDGAIRRRRVCWSCEHRFTTLEVIVRDSDETGKRHVRTILGEFDAARDKIVSLAAIAENLASDLRREAAALRSPAVEMEPDELMV